MKVIRISAGIMLLMIFAWDSNAQLGFLNPGIERDSNYIKNYDNAIVGRVFLQRKYTDFSIPGSTSDQSFKYLSNGKILVGAGFIYRALNLNISFGLPYFTDAWKARGQTKSLDLQTYIFGRKLMYDLYGQFYKGYYINHKNFVPGFDNYYYRDDIRLRLFGGTMYYVFNPKKYSFRMALLQDEWQKKSSGTFLLNFEAFYGFVNSDSGGFIIPQEIAASYGNANVERFRFFNFGPGAGYAYNLIIKKHFFVTASLNANIAGSFTREETLDGYKDKFKITPNLSYLASAGYNNDKWIVSFSWLNSGQYYRGYLSEGDYTMRTGLYRLSLARRFNNGKFTSKVLHPVDKVLEKNILDKIFKKKDKEVMNTDMED